MSWLRLDDGFTKHPKFDGWTAAQKWAWLEVMEYCARYETAGVVPADLSLMPRSTTPALLARASASGLLDVLDDGSRKVHDWDFYNPTAPLEDRVRTALSEYPAASANDVWQIVGGRRQAVLSLVARFRSGSRSGSREPDGNRFPSGSQTVPKSGSYPTLPNPSEAKGSDVEREKTKAVDVEDKQQHQNIAYIIDDSINGSNGLEWSTPDETPIPDLIPDVDLDAA